MKEIFLKAKHWQLFIIMFVIPGIISLFLIFPLLETFINFRTSEPEFTVEFVLYILIFILITMSPYYIWIWSVVTELHKKIPENLYMSLKKFKVIFISPLILFSLIVLFFLVFFDIESFSISELNGTLIIGLFVAYFLLIFYSAFCSIYVHYFIAKTIKSVLLRREAKFSEYVEEIALIYFLYIGIWLLQPKINKLVEE